MFAIKGKKCMLIFTIFILLLFTMSSLATANTINNDSNKAVKSEILTPEKGSEGILDEVELFNYDNNKKRIIIKGKDICNDESWQILVKADPVNGTYKAIKTVQNKMEKSKPQISPKALTSYNSVRVTLSTVDPIGIECCKTKHWLKWKYGGGEVEFYARNVTGWAGNPTAAGTHWYKDYARYNGSYWYDYENGKKVWVSSETESKYHNYDFGLPNLVTNAYHVIDIGGGGYGGYSYLALHDCDGEFSILLSGERALRTRSIIYSTYL